MKMKAKKYVCGSSVCVGCCFDPCSYVYDPEAGEPDRGVAPGTPFEDLPEDYACPSCGAGKEAFRPLDDFLPAEEK